MQREASELVHRLARDAEAVCRYYLRMEGGRGVTGWLAMSETHRAAPCSSG